MVRTAPQELNPAAIPQLKPVAIVIPVYRIPLTGDEEFSLERARTVLGKHPRFFVAPASLDIPPAFLRGELIVRFPDRFFTYPHGYNRLLMTRRFFRAFGNFSHLLIYQLDCLVFRDELLDWCARNYDYVGSPWYENYIYDYQHSEKWWVGNGGFSLRKTASALGILAMRVPRGSCFPVPPASLPKPTPTRWLFGNLRSRARQVLGLWTVEDELINYGESEDRFWALDAGRFSSTYKIPTPIEAMRFGIEQQPRECFRLAGGRPPFGCHAWSKYDRAFILNLIAHSDGQAPS